MIVAIFLLLMEEEDAFWMMTAVIEEILPPSYYSPRYIDICLSLITNVIKVKYWPIKINSIHIYILLKV